MQQAQMLPCLPGFNVDKNRLVFKAFFQETVQEKWKTAFHVRVVNISFFLEDGTMKIVEPSVDNSGLEQGVLVRRQRVPIPDSVKYRYYDILDLNVGKEPEIYGRVYKIVDCDKFTRQFLNRLGIPVPDPLDIPKDPYREIRKDEAFPKKPNRMVDTLGNFLKYDRQVLRFYGYWDDTESPHGIIHDLELHYYLSDNTIEVKEIVLPNAGRDSGPMLVKRMKIPKFYSGSQPLGVDSRFTVLNVLGENARHSYYMIDSLDTGKTVTDYYKDNELGIGAEINVFGRRVIITDMDAFTKEYYRTKYGLDDFTSLIRPRKADDMYQKVERYIPPYNGFGSYDDSLGNCFTVVPKPPKTDFIKFLYHDRQGFNSHILRFRAKMVSKIPGNEERQFIIRVFLVDDTISVFELAKRNSGFQRSLFQKRMPIILPDQDIFTSKKPEYYKSHDFYIGARLNLRDFHFEITSADVYALRYMELHCDKFPKANRKLIMEKLRENLQPVYKEFIQLYAPPKDNIRILEYEKLKEALCRYMGDKITEHEMITIARYYSSREKIEHRSREYVRCLLHTELHRSLWNDLVRLEEDLRYWDEDKTGFLSRESLYTILRGCRIPVDVELLNSMLDQATIEVNQVKKKGIIDTWVSLEQAKHGMVHLRLMWLQFSKDPADLKAALVETQELRVTSMSTALLTLYIDSAKNLPCIRANKQPDVYLEASVGAKKVTTSIVSRSCNPVWEQGFTFLISNPETGILHIKIIDKKTAMIVGEISYNLSLLLEKNNLEVTQQPYDLQKAEADSKLVLSMSLNILRYVQPEPTSEEDEDDQDINELNKRIERQESTISNVLSSSVPPSPLKKQPSKESINSQPRSGSAAAILPEEAAVEEELIFSANAPSSTESPQLIHRNPSITSSSGEAKLGRIQLTIRYSMQRQKLSVFVHKVANLPQNDPYNIPDPYVKLYLLPDKHKETKRKTAVIKDNCSPSFDEQFEYIVSQGDLNTRVLEVSVCTQKGWLSTGSKVMGQVHLKLNEINISKTVTGWYDLQPEIKD